MAEFRSAIRSLVRSNGPKLEAERPRSASRASALPQYAHWSILLGLTVFSALPLAAATHVSPLNPAPQPGPQITQPAPPPPELPKTVERLAAQPKLSAPDCAKLADDTITFGESVRQSGQPVKPGVVRDGLDAVSLGERLDGKAADWPGLRSKLQELLTPPPPQKKPEDKKDEKKQDQDKNQKQDKPDQQKPDQSKQEQEKQEPPKEQEKEKKQEQEQEKEQQKQPPEQPKPAEPPPTQKVGGEPPPDQELRENPQLAEPLQKLEQVRDQDKPAVLYQLMQDQEPKSGGKPKKDW